MPWIFLCLTGKHLWAETTQNRINPNVSLPNGSARCYAGKGIDLRVKVQFQMFVEIPAYQW